MARGVPVLHVAVPGLGEGGAVPHVFDTGSARLVHPAPCLSAPQPCLAAGTAVPLVFASQTVSAVGTPRSVVVGEGCALADTSTVHAYPPADTIAPVAGFGVGCEQWLGCGAAGWVAELPSPTAPGTLHLGAAATRMAARGTGHHLTMALLPGRPWVAVHAVQWEGGALHTLVLDTGCATSHMPGGVGGTVWVQGRAGAVPLPIPQPATPTTPTPLPAGVGVVGMDALAGWSVGCFVHAGTVVLTPQQQSL